MLQRRVKFYLFNLIIPGILIAFLSLFSFYLPPLSGERVGLIITNFLSLSVYVLMVSENTPPSSESVPLLVRLVNGFLFKTISKCSFEISKAASWYCMKSVRIRSFSGPYFPTFGLNTEYLSIFSPNAWKHRPEKLRIQVLFTQHSDLYFSTFVSEIFRVLSLLLRTYCK